MSHPSHRLSEEEKRSQGLRPQSGRLGDDIEDREERRQREEGVGIIWGRGPSGVRRREWILAGIGFIADAPLTQRSYERRRWENEDDCRGRGKGKEKNDREGEEEEEERRRGSDRQERRYVCRIKMYRNSGETIKG